MQAYKAYYNNGKFVLIGDIGKLRDGTQAIVTILDDEPAQDDTLNEQSAANEKVVVTGKDEKSVVIISMDDYKDDNDTLEPFILKQYISIS
jgi:hypothetical protein